jgi:BlaI family transcriptional regulator, penicillinase repressor
MSDSESFPPPLSRRERQIMDVLYRDGEATVAEVMERMTDPPGYSAVRATLRVLEQKGHATHREDGPRYVYLPAVPREDAREDALRHVMTTFFDGSLEQTVTALLQMSDTELNPARVERLQALIRQAREEGR